MPVNPRVSAAAALCPDSSLALVPAHVEGCTEDLSSFLVSHSFVPEALWSERCARWSWDTSQIQGRLTRPTPHPTGSLRRKEMKSGLNGL